MKTKIINARIFTPIEILDNHDIIIEDGKILAVTPRDNDLVHKFSDVTVINAAGFLVTPGLIDIHIHGCMGGDTMDASLQTLETMSLFMIRHGVTSFYATTVTNPAEKIDQALDIILNSQGKLPGANAVGVHIEGPYINAMYKGAQNPAFLRTPQEEEYTKWIDKNIVRMITVAPELEGSDDLIQYCIQRKVAIAIGHSGASYEQVTHASDLGASQATHLFNGMLGLHHRELGTAGAVLCDERLYAQIIADGIHLHPAIIKLIIKAKGIDRVILITDAMRATGLPDGEYDLGGQLVHVANGTARIANGSLAGSTLTLDQAIRNTMEFTGLPFQSVLEMASSVPAKAMGITETKGFIRSGNDADLTFFDPNYQVKATMIAGELKYKDKSFGG
ncbi:MAG TPA: N-acetylglucosamine-6-phosphate deacetylase [Anaerolineaceae bacterium]|nr:N-acetylglucosamine-6-phosphate deacetylase [Anaerolineaceae bacterium]